MTRQTLFRNVTSQLNEIKACAHFVWFLETLTATWSGVSWRHSTRGQFELHCSFTSIRFSVTRYSRILSRSRLAALWRSVQQFYSQVKHDETMWELVEKNGCKRICFPSQSLFIKFTSISTSISIFIYISIYIYTTIFISIYIDICIDFKRKILIVVPCDSWLREPHGYCDWRQIQWFFWQHSGLGNHTHERVESNPPITKFLS